jgi:hypothetical protein
MKKLTRAVLGMAMAVAAAGAVPSLAAEKWLHVSVVDGKGGSAERVRVNVPLSFAEKVLPAIQVDRLDRGRIRIEEGEIHGVDLKAILEAVRDVRDGEFVTVEGDDENVRISKSKGYLLATVVEGKGSRAMVEVKVPMTVVEALISEKKNELDLGAAIRALAAHGDAVLVNVTDEDSRVRIWVDSRNDSKGE